MKSRSEETFGPHPLRVRELFGPKPHDSRIDFRYRKPGPDVVFDGITNGYVSEHIVSFLIFRYDGTQDRFDIPAAPLVRHYWRDGTMHRFRVGCRCRGNPTCAICVWATYAKDAGKWPMREIVLDNRSPSRGLLRRVSDALRAVVASVAQWP